MLDATMSVQDSHAVNDKIVREIKCRFKDSKVMVHIEPCDNALLVRANVLPLVL